LENGRLRLVSYGEAPSKGWTKGCVSDHKALTESMLAAIRDAESRAPLLSGLGAAVLGIGGPTIHGINTRDFYELGHPREIGPADVQHAIERASGVVLPPDHMLLHVAPQEFSVDGRAGHRNPCGMVGSKLEAFVHLVTTTVPEHQGLVGAANLAHWSIEETVFEGLAAAYAALLPEDRREGVAVLDIGAHSGELAVYYGEALVMTHSVPICGDHFTRDIAKGLCVSPEEAEWIKLQHGCAQVEQTAWNSLIEIPSPSDRGPRQRFRRELSIILEARAIDLFTYVKRELARVGMDQNLVGAVLTGGAARLPGLCDLAEQVLNCQVVCGLPVGIQDWPKELDNPAWTTAAGLAMYSARLKLRAELNRRNGFFRSIWT
jgi:cell division protein FtsA